MPQSRRVFIRGVTVALPGLACAALASRASASDRPGPAAGVLDGGKPLDPFADARASCPLCRAAGECPQHPLW